MLVVIKMVNWLKSNMIHIINIHLVIAEYLNVDTSVDFDFFSKRFNNIFKNRKIKKIFF